MSSSNIGIISCEIYMISHFKSLAKVHDIAEANDQNIKYEGQSMMNVVEFIKLAASGLQSDD